MARVLTVVMCGGVGMRLWPLSCSKHPKQFLAFDGNKLSFFQQSIKRFSQLSHDILVIGNQEHMFVIADQIKQLNLSATINNVHVILEPCRKNTLVTAIIACIWAVGHGYDKVLLVPSDHVISDDIVDAVRSNLSYTDKITTFAIKPTSPNTEYGYIKIGKHIAKDIYNVLTFKEKPNLELATAYLADASMYWNSGMFLLPSNLFLEEVIKYHEYTYNVTLNSYNNKSNFHNFSLLRSVELDGLPNLSIDYGILERSSEVNAILCNNLVKWCDIGSWRAIYNEYSEGDCNSMVYGNVLHSDMLDSIVINYTESMSVVCQDIKNLAVVAKGNTLFVSNISSTTPKSDFIKRAIDVCQEQLWVREVKLWGFATVILNGVNFKVKKIEINPLKSISMQLHKNRSEHWIILTGCGYMQIENQSPRMIYANESVYIPQSVKHKISNTSEVESLVFIEIQCGLELSENDIIRFD